MIREKLICRKLEKQNVSDYIDILLFNFRQITFSRIIFLVTNN